jgi:DNA-binding CsgD family transcriptional regulator
MIDRSLRQHLDGLRCGVLLCDPSARVHWLNHSARRLLDTGQPLSLFAQRLRGRSNADTEALKRELADAERAPSNNVRYLRLGNAHDGVHVAIQSADCPSTLALFLTPARELQHVPQDALVRIFDLTPTEAGLLSALVTGSTVDEYAQQRGVSVGTARMQLKQVLSKTGASRQSELVRLVLSSAVAQVLNPEFGEAT